MKLTPVKRVPALIALVVIVVICAVRLLHFEFFERLERLTYDMRVREAQKFPSPAATNLGFILIDESSIDFIRTNHSLGYRAGLYWPRHIYGRLVQELASQGARALAFDVIFGELRPDHSPVVMADGTSMESDEFFALQMQRSGKVILAATDQNLPPALFLTNAADLGEVSTEKDRPEGVLRRALAFRVHREWHPLFLKAQEEFGFDLSKARIEKTRIVLQRDKEELGVPLDADGNFAVADFVGDKLPAGMSARARPFSDRRIWSMGIILAARQLQLDLANAEVDFRHGRIVLRGPNGIQRVIPVDQAGYFYIDWSLPPGDPRLTKESVQTLLIQNQERLKAPTNVTDSAWAGKLAIVGSSALGSDLSDRGATPLGEDTLLVSKHWNIANSILTGRMVHRSPLAADLGLIALLGMIAAVLTWELRVVPATALVVVVGVLYIGLATFLFVQGRLWLPLVLPLLGAMLMVYGSMMGWKVMFEQAEVRRIKSIFAEIVSPKIMRELLHAETLALGGARREVTVLFSDVRGFTALTDTAQEQATELIRKQQLSEEAAEAIYGEQARETLETVNVYLGLVADIIIKQDGTLDKYIGDCVMAFWGAPTPNPRSAVACVHAAIEAQRAIEELNRQRAAENKSRELENKARLSAGLKTKPMLPLLMLGTGINTGMATAGLMGSQAKQKNYTVFGREVNLASRLESLSGHGHIFISESTYQHLRRDEPALAALCVAQGAKTVKGIVSALNVYEVPWRTRTGTVASENSRTLQPDLQAR